MTARLAPEALRLRIVRALHAPSHALDGFVRLLDILVDDTVASAAIECDPRPRLLLNPSFLAEHCRSDAHLAMLVLHEIYHLLYGHTKLFPCVTEAQNIAFDAIVNATLCHRFPAEAYRSFFEALNPADSFPGCLLRPPPGWPERSQPPETLPERVREIVRALYGTCGVGFEDLVPLLEQASLTGANAGAACAVLLGEHGRKGEQPPSTGTTSASADLVGSASLLLQSLGHMNMPGRGMGGELETTKVPARSGDPRAVKQLRRMLRTLGLPDVGSAVHMQEGQDARAIESALPQLHDRRAVVRGFLGAPPLLFRSELPHPRLVRQSAIVHVYFDVSGSTSFYQPFLLAAVRPHVERGLCRVHAFSTRVVDLTLEEMRRASVDTTFGTAGSCVTAHMMEHEVTRALLLTDGCVGEFPVAHLSWVQRRRAIVDVALTPQGYRDDLRPIARKFVVLAEVASGAKDEEEEEEEEKKEEEDMVGFM